MSDLPDERLPVRGSPPDLAPFTTDAEAAQDFARASRAENTKRAYRTDWADFTYWCGERGRASLPASTETVALYISSRAAGERNENGTWHTRPLKVATLQRRLSAINQAHRTKGVPPPAKRSEEPLHSVWAGIVRKKSLVQDQAAPALTDDLLHVLEAMTETPAQLQDERADVQSKLAPLVGSRSNRQPSKQESDLRRRAAVLEGLIQRERLAAARDRSLFLLGFAGALRRSELAQIEVSHVSFGAEGLLLQLPRSKSDQEGQGAALGILYGQHVPTCPVRSLRAWLRVSGITEGAVFRGIDRHGHLGACAMTGRTVANIIKKRFGSAGLDPTPYSGHSLRAGFCTQAARAGEHERDIMRHSRHKDVHTLRKYIRAGTTFQENPTRSLGL